MTRRQIGDLRELEGHRIGLALSDGSRIDDCELVAVGRPRGDRLWVHTNGADTFVPMIQIADFWEVRVGHG
jgi:hypothetical protein